jgi:MFS transporter, NHS family, xanthosine permease
MIKLRLTILSFLQFFIWGSWLITIATFWFENKAWGPDDFGKIFSTMGISALFMPAIAGILSDRYINAERLYGILHLLGGVGLFLVPMAKNSDEMFWYILITMLFYMPTISLSNTVMYAILSRDKGIDMVKVFPPIRVWGTVGFIVALWTISLTGHEADEFQFYLGGVVSFILGAYAFSLPACAPLGKNLDRKGFLQSLGLNAFALFKNYRYAVFFLFAMLLGAALQLTNAYGDVYLHSFDSVSEFKDSIAVKFPAIISSIAQISETLFILAIPFFMKRFGIKQIMLISMIAWVLRFGLFAYGDPGSGLWMIILSCIIYGMAFDFFNISGSLFIEKSVEPEIRSSAQGLFTMMVNGVGAVLGSRISGWAMETYFTTYQESEGKLIPIINWQGTWLSFTAYAAIVAVLFVFLFREKEELVKV